MTAAASIRLGPGTPLTTLLRVVLGLCAIAVFIGSAIPILTTFPVALDALIPLKAAERWLAGGIVYDPAGFIDLNLLPPFLYPPFVLPLVAPLTLLPELVVHWAWVGILLALAIWTCRRLAIPWLIIPAILIWTPMLGGIWGANVAVAMFAAFVATFWRAPGRHDLEPRPRDLDGTEHPGPRIGFLAAGVAAVKVSQAQAWLAIARRSPGAALLGAVPWLLLVLVTLPLVGVGSYGAWLTQVARASDPTWEPMGPSLLRYAPAIVFAALTLASLAAAVLVRGRDTGIWIGLLILLVTPNMHVHSGLFLIPALLRIRREFALLAALLTGTLTDEGWWLGIAIVVGVMLAGERWSFLREPRASDAVVTG